MPGTPFRSRSVVPALLCALAAVAAARAGDPAPLGSFRVTYYWVAVEDDRYAGLPRTEALKDDAGRTIAHVAQAYRRALELEGTGRLADGRVLNVSGRVAGRYRYVLLPAADDGPWGLGARGEPLQPFVSVATDPTCIPRGSWIYLPSFAGWELPDGTHHTGMFRADDVGSAIVDARIDVFIGDRSHLGRAERCVPSHASTEVLRFP